MPAPRVASGQRSELKGRDEVHGDHRCDEDDSRPRAAVNTDARDDAGNRHWGGEHRRVPPPGTRVWHPGEAPRRGRHHDVGFPTPLPASPHPRVSPPFPPRPRGSALRRPNLQGGAPIVTHAGGVVQLFGRGHHFFRQMPRCRGRAANRAITAAAGTSASSLSTTCTLCSLRVGRRAGKERSSASRRGCRASSFLASARSAGLSVPLHIGRGSNMLRAWAQQHARCQGLPRGAAVGPRIPWTACQGSGVGGSH